MKIFFSSLLLLVSLSVFSQRVVTLTQDLVLTETLVISIDTHYEGNGYNIICDGCKPVIKVEGNTRVHFQNINFKRGYLKWMRADSEANVTWNSPIMKGHLYKIS